MTSIDVTVNRHTESIDRTLVHFLVMSPRDDSISTPCNCYPRKYWHMKSTPFCIRKTYHWEDRKSTWSKVRWKVKINEFQGPSKVLKIHRKSTWFCKNRNFKLCSANSFTFGVWIFTELLCSFMLRGTQSFTNEKKMFQVRHFLPNRNIFCVLF